MREQRAYGTERACGGREGVWEQRGHMGAERVYGGTVGMWGQREHIGAKRAFGDSEHRTSGGRAERAHESTEGEGVQEQRAYGDREYGG